MLKKPLATSGDNTVFKKVKGVDTGAYYEDLTSFSIKNDGNVYLNKNRNEEIPLSEVKREFIKELVGAAGKTVNVMQSLLNKVAEADVIMNNTNTIIAKRSSTPFDEYKKRQEKLAIKENIDIDDYRNSNCVSLNDYEYMKECERTGSYGVDQGIFMKDINNNNYNDIIYLEDKYKMNVADATKTAFMIDSLGACTYTSLLNNLERQYRNNPEIIEETLGIPLYKYDNKGYKSINSTELLADLFIKANSEEISDKEKPLFKIDKKTGQVTVINDNLYVNQAYFISKTYYGKGHYGVNIDLIEKTLESKGKKVEIKEKSYNHGNATSNLDVIVPNVQRDIASGYECTIAIYSGNKIYNISDQNTENFDKNKSETTTINGGHAVKITGITKDGFIVSSWGQRMYILYDDLKENDNYFIYSTKIEIE